MVRVPLPPSPKDARAHELTGPTAPDRDVARCRYCIWKTEHPKAFRMRAHALICEGIPSDKKELVQQWQTEKDNKKQAKEEDTDAASPIPPAKKVKREVAPPTAAPKCVRVGGEGAEGGAAMAERGRREELTRVFASLPLTSPFPPPSSSQNPRDGDEVSRHLPWSVPPPNPSLPLSPLAHSRLAGSPRLDFRQARARHAHPARPPPGLWLRSRHSGVRPSFRSPPRSPAAPPAHVF